MSSEAFKGAIPIDGLPPEFANWITQFSQSIVDSSLIPTGTKMVFVEPAAPTGWTLHTLLNDVFLRVTRTEADGGQTGGDTSWDFTGASATDHTLTTAEMPTHSHTLTNGTLQLRSAGGSLAVTGAGAAWGTSTITVDNAGSGNAHNHGLTNTSWRPAYVDTIICEKA